MKKLTLSRIIKLLPETECGCEICKRVCSRRPCWPTPAEANALIVAGFADRMMLDFWCGTEDRENILIVCPAIVGHEGETAPFFPIGQCILQDKDGGCVLHAKGLKPIEGRLATHREYSSPLRRRADDQLHRAVSDAWDCDEGKLVVGRWHNTLRRKYIKSKK